MDLSTLVKMSNAYGSNPAYVLAGGGVVISRAHEIFREAVEKTNVPVVTTVMGKGAIPTDHPKSEAKRS